MMSYVEYLSLIVAVTGANAMRRLTVPNRAGLGLELADMHRSLQSLRGTNDLKGP